MLLNQDTFFEFETDNKHLDYDKLSDFIWWAKWFVKPV